jgi:TM2 domain-containing membrane protein YozV
LVWRAAIVFITLERKMIMAGRRCSQDDCGHENAWNATFCARCGCPLSSGVVAHAATVGLPLRSVGVAYGLWALCIVGVAGIHRFYLGRYVTGVLWLLTWGFLGIGLLIDLFLISGMVQRKNWELASYQAR